MCCDLKNKKNLILHQFDKQTADKPIPSAFLRYVFMYPKGIVRLKHCSYCYTLSQTLGPLILLVMNQLNVSKLPHLLPIAFLQFLYKHFVDRNERRKPY